ncbi:MFS transporter [Acinetobacter sp. ANC 3813]|uniref:MFS transporter n=1 Tax=Acinetobacter sp. ANC 3813 TaxID=1977873 RepID=UPI000A348A35|nr:MFS transporter [Acinetobacter sp. ANC 3813]OTG90903.1 hypothetical protein B9T34_05885 [Acinetobacter sp. ANC 3813]
MSIDIKAAIENKAMSRYQWAVVTLLAVLFLIDGLDFMIMTFVANSVAQDLALTSTQVGLLISMGLIGMTVGSIFISPLADKIGRRNLILISLVICFTSMFGSGIANTMNELLALRFISGLGLGGISTVCMVLASEYSSKKNKGLSVAILSACYGAGGFLGGMLTKYYINDFGWRYIFIAAGVITLVMFFVSLKALPESIEYLMYKKPKNALQRLNHLLNKMEMDTVQNLPELELKTEAKGSFKLLLSGQYIRQTVLLWFAMFFILFGFYFILGFTPKIIAASGLSNEQSIQIGMMVSLGAIVGSIILGVLTTKIGLFKSLMAFLICNAISMICFVALSNVLTFMIVFGIALGMFVAGSLAGTYSTTMNVYDANMRSTGLGVATGVGRFGGISSPITAGYLLDQGIPALTLYGYFALIFVFAALAIFVLYRLINRQPHLAAQTS